MKHDFANFMSRFRCLSKFGPSQIYLITGGNRDDKFNFGETQMKHFIESYLMMCRRHGMTIPNPSDMQMIEATMEDVRKLTK